MTTRIAIPRRPTAIAAVVTALALAACARRPPPASTGDRDRPITNRGSTVAVDAGPPPPDASADCVEACVRSRQMEAVSIEHIRDSCARQCSQPAAAQP